MKKINFFCLLFILFVFSDVLLPQSNHTYKNVEYAFQLDYPEGWNSYSANEPEGFVFLAINSENSAFISVIVLKSKEYDMQKKSIDDYSEEDLLSLLSSKTEDDVEIKNITKKKIDNTTAIYASSVGLNKEGIKKFINVYMLIRNNMIYGLLGYANYDDPYYDEKFFINLFEKGFKFL